MRPPILSLLTALFAIALAALCAAPIVRTLDARVNAVSTSDADTTAGARARELHARLWIADLHCDATLWNRPLLERSARGHVDLPRLVEGNVALEVFSLANAYPLGANYRRTPGTTDLMGALRSRIAGREPHGRLP
jgi:hypothetical protein